VNTKQFKRGIFWIRCFALGKFGERWRKLCEQAAIEQDSDRLLELIKEINRLLEEKEERLKSARKPNDQIQ
jgi:cell shape-determining protein MreC